MIESCPTSLNVLQPADVSGNDADLAGLFGCEGVAHLSLANEITTAAFAPKLAVRTFGFAFGAQESSFGYYAPSPLQSFLINLANRTSLGRGRIRWWTSALLERLKSGPVDVER